jgi:hypothetical protein
MDPEWLFLVVDPSITGPWLTAPSHDGRDGVIWRPHPSLDVVLVEIIAKAVCDCNHNYFFLSRSGEIFFNPDEAYERLQNWAMCRGLPWFSGVRRPGMQPVGFLCV